MVLTGDLDSPRGHVAHRVIGAMVTERQLEGAPTQGQAQQLVSETNSKHRNIGSDEFANVGRCIKHHLGVAWAIRQKHAVGSPGDDLAGWRVGRHHMHVGNLTQTTQNCLLHTKVVRHHRKRLGRKGRFLRMHRVGMNRVGMNRVSHVIRRQCADLCHQVATGRALFGGHSRLQRGQVSGAECAEQRTRVAQ